MDQDSKAGYVAIVGRPNVGKSTLLNHLLGFKLSITSRKPQTTRQRILGVLTKGTAQLVFIDTPGVHSGAQVTGRIMNRYMNHQATSALSDVDAVLFLVDSRGWVPADEHVVAHLKSAGCPVICVLNKVDTLKQKERLLPLMQLVADKIEYAAIVPISALKFDGLDVLIDEVIKLLPLNQHIFNDNDMYDKPSSFFVAELVREQLVRQLGDELPHRTAVTIENTKSKASKTVIHAIIWVERKSQKGMVIGKNGQRLKLIGQSARVAIAKFLGCEVDLFLTVRIRRGWTNDLKSLTLLGYR